MAISNSSTWTWLPRTSIASTARSRLSAKPSPQACRNERTEIMTTQQKPAFAAYAVTGRGHDQDDWWTPVGAAFPHKDGEGYNIVLQAIPLDGKIALRPRRRKTRTTPRARSRQSARKMMGARLPVATAEAAHIALKKFGCTAFFMGTGRANCEGIRGWPWSPEQRRWEAAL